MERELEKLEINLGGVSNMTRLPDVVFVADPKREAIATKEVNKLGIPLVGLVDTNCDPDEVDYLIPGNDDAIRSCSLIVKTLARAVEEGRQKVQVAEFLAAEEAREKAEQLKTAPVGEEAASEAAAFPGFPAFAAACRWGAPRRPRAAPVAAALAVGAPTMSGGRHLAGAGRLERRPRVVRSRRHRRRHRLRKSPDRSRPRKPRPQAPVETPAKALRPRLRLRPRHLRPRLRLPPRRLRLQLKLRLNRPRLPRPLRRDPNPRTGDGEGHLTKPLASSDVAHVVCDV